MVLGRLLPGVVAFVTEDHETVVLWALVLAVLLWVLVLAALVWVLVLPLVLLDAKLEVAADDVCTELVVLRRVDVVEVVLDDDVDVVDVLSVVVVTTRELRVFVGNVEARLTEGPAVGGAIAACVVV